MPKTRQKIKKSDYAYLETDENGKTVMFDIPLAALYYDMACVSLRAQDGIDDTMDELIEMFYSLNEN